VEVQVDEEGEVDFLEEEDEEVIVEVIDEDLVVGIDEIGDNFIFSFLNKNKNKCDMYFENK
jgi:hypothetical protein